MDLVGSTDDIGFKNESGLAVAWSNRSDQLVVTTNRRVMIFTVQVGSTSSLSFTHRSIPVQGSIINRDGSILICQNEIRLRRVIN